MPNKILRYCIGALLILLILLLDAKFYILSRHLFGEVDTRVLLLKNETSYFIIHMIVRIILYTCVFQLIINRKEVSLLFAVVYCLFLFLFCVFRMLPDIVSIALNRGLSNLIITPLFFILSAGGWLMMNKKLFVKENN